MLIIESQVMSLIFMWSLFTYSSFENQLYAIKLFFILNYSSSVSLQTSIHKLQDITKHLEGYRFSCDLTYNRG